jgi:hypothetical protein
LSAPIRCGEVGRPMPVKTTHLTFSWGSQSPCAGPDRCHFLTTAAVRGWTCLCVRRDSIRSSSEISVASEGYDPGFWGKLPLRRRGGKSDNDVTSASSVSVPVLKKRSYRRIAGLRDKNASGGAKIETGAGQKGGASIRIGK